MAGQPTNIPPPEIRPYDQGLLLIKVFLNKALLIPYFWGGVETLGGGRLTSHEGLKTSGVLQQGFLQAFVGGPIWRKISLTPGIYL